MPPKRGVSAYFFFCDERRSAARAALTAELGEENVRVTTVAKRLGQEWRQLSDEQRNGYKTAAANKIVRDEDEAIEEGGENTVGASNDEEQAAKFDLVLPLSAVKRVMRLDDEISGISGGAVTATAKATELMLEALIQDAYSHAVSKKRRKLLFADVLAVLSGEQRWIDMGMLELIEESPAFEDVRAARAGAGIRRPKPMEIDPKAQKITSFFPN